MKTWRERIVEARERGTFSEEDSQLACSAATCAVGEASERMGHPYEVYLRTWLLGEPEATAACPTWTLGVQHSASFTGAVMTGNIDRAEEILDQIEDRWLQLKRECSPPSTER